MTETKIKKPFKETLIGKLLTKGVGTPAEIIGNSAISLIADKTRDADSSFVKDKTRKGISISSKRSLNLGVTGSIIVTALFLIQANGLNKWNLTLVGVGVAYSLGMSLITVWKEK